RRSGRPAATTFTRGCNGDQGEAGAEACGTRHAQGPRAHQGGHRAAHRDLRPTGEGRRPGDRPRRALLAGRQAADPEARLLEPVRRADGWSCIRREIAMASSKATTVEQYLA